MGKQLRLLSLLLFLPAVSSAQTPQPVPAQPPLFEELSDNQWIRLSGSGQPRREARLLEHSTTEIVLDLEPQPLRMSVTSIDTLWERGNSSKTGALIGGLVGAAVGVLIATQAVEKGEIAPADYVAVFAIGGGAGGGLLGALVGLAVPGWHRVYTR